ncbi:MAG: hypothetical protein K8S99_13960 [Planctomycetes bacterium]|nr:hypothetical protein [Planctomycetota bacterium]
MSVNENSPSVEASAAEAARLTQLLGSHRAFSFLRLGDGEIQCMLAVKAGKMPPRYNEAAYKPPVNVEHAFSISGIEARHFTRLYEAFEKCDYLDYCDSIQINQRHIPELGLNRDPALFRNPSTQASNIIFAWTHFQLYNYVRAHRCLLAGAESALLREMTKDPRYIELSKGFWPADANVVFHQVRNNGMRFSENLDLIKEDLRRDIELYKIDTLILSLATGAKILCYELAREMNIRCVDFGSMTRALTYSGSPGYQAYRNYHNPFIFRVPLDVYMPALERAYPEMTLPTLITKSHAQVALEIQDLAPFRFNTSDMISNRVDVSPERRAGFWSAVGYYNRVYRPRARRDAEARELDKKFTYWRRKKGLGWDAKVFLLLVKIKGLLRRMLGKKLVPLSEGPSTPTRS